MPFYCANLFVKRRAFLNSITLAKTAIVNGSNMKATLTFNLPDEESEFQHAQRGIDMSIAISDFDNYLRAELKHNGDAYTDKEYELLDKMRTKLRECLSGHDVLTLALG